MKNKHYKKALDKFMVGLPNDISHEEYVWAVNQFYTTLNCTWAELKDSLDDLGKSIWNITPLFVRIPISWMKEKI